MSRKIKIGPCTLVIEDEGECPDPDYIKVYLFTRYAMSNKIVFKAVTVTIYTKL